MKNIFGYNIQTGRYDGATFIAKTADGTVKAQLDKARATIAEGQKVACLPLPLRITMYICGLMGTTIVLATLMSMVDIWMGEITWEQYANNTPGLWIVGGVLLLVALVLFFISLHKRRRVKTSDRYNEAVNNTRVLSGKSLAQLGVPANAVTIDVFGAQCGVSVNAATFYGVFDEMFKPHRGKERPTYATAQYVNTEMRLFAENGCLCLADAEHVFAVPIDCIQRIVRVNKRATFDIWNKQTPFNKGEYKPYKIRATDYSALTIKPTYSIRIMRSAEEYEIVVPAYEIDKILPYVNVGISDN